MREHDVKMGLLRYLGDRHGPIVEEVCLGRGRTRADVVVLGPDFLGFEIKSEKDTLSRLQRQLEDYRQVFREVTLVIGLNHLTGTLSGIPSWCGVLLATPVGGRVEIEPFRDARPNHNQDRLALAQLLWRDEAIKVARRHGCLRGVKSKPRRYLWERLAENLSADELTEAVIEMMSLRGKRWRADLTLPTLNSLSRG